MKTCEVCRQENASEAETCAGCGEASWTTSLPAESQVSREAQPELVATRRERRGR